MWKRFFSKKILLQEIMRDTGSEFSDWIHKYFSGEKSSEHTSRRRAPVLRSETLPSSPASAGMTNAKYYL